MGTFTLNAMITKCDRCGAIYNDEHKLTLCPHPNLHGERLASYDKIALAIDKYIDAKLATFHATEIEALGDRAGALKAQQVAWHELVSLLARELPR